MEINGIPASAPLFKATPEADLAAVISHLKSASYHYADDSGGEWGKAREYVVTAAAIVNAHCLSHRAIECLHKEARPLVTLSQFFDAVLDDLRPPQPIGD